MYTRAKTAKAPAPSPARAREEFARRYRVSQKIVGIAGQQAVFRFRAPVACDVLNVKVEFMDLPPFLSADDPPVAFPVDDPRGAMGEVRLQALEPGRGVARLQLDEELFVVPCVVFRPVEFFVTLLISSNFHIGFDPLSYLFGDSPEARDLDLRGHAYPKTRQLERLYHTRGIPITWLIDGPVAETAAEDLRRWHVEMGDDLAALPSSLFNHNCLNFNTDRTEAETRDLLLTTLEEVEAPFDFFTTIAGADQWVGSVGTNFTRAAYSLGLAGLWGVGFDHLTCDTSMFHRGCPWDVYKPDRENFRIPAAHSSRLWMFQWTTRDIINTVHTPSRGPGGAVMFSTDPDDIRVCGIMAHQHDYWTRLLREYKNNLRAGEKESPLGPNDHFVFTLHQEDHDCHFPEDADALRRFLDDIKDEVTFATLEEVAAWLNLKYEAGDHPSQFLAVEDVLQCRSKLNFFAGVEPPHDWPEDDKTYPPHIAFYDTKGMGFIQKPERLPRRFFHFASRHRTEETGSYPECPLPQVQVISEKWDRMGRGWRYQLRLKVERGFAGLPWAIWEVPKTFEPPPRMPHGRAWFERIRALFITLDVKAGQQELEIFL
ncbi:MAG: hypothetical protein V2A74_10755 [bacterium]